MTLDPTFRPATRADAGPLAVLIDIAGNGMPNGLWLDQAGPGYSALEVGRQMVLRDDSEDSYRNATIAMIRTEIAGCSIGGLPEQLYSRSSIDEKPALFRTVARLALQAAGAWYVDVMATFPEFRGQGLGGKLLEYAATKANEIGASATTLVVGSWNDGAARLYARYGYEPTVRETAALPEHFPYSGDWILMTRPLT